jgi:hypothetical protein
MNLPEFVSPQQAGKILDMSDWEVRSLVTTKKLTSSSYEEIPLRAVGQYIGELKGWDGDYTDTFMNQRLNNY